MPGDTIVRQLMVSGGGPPGITSRDRHSGFGQLRVAAATAEERQAKKLSLLLDISQKLSGEFDLDKLLRNVVDMMFEVMNVDRVSIVLRNETTGELLPSMSRSRLGDTELQQVPRSIAEKVVQERVAVVSDNTADRQPFQGTSIVMQSVRSAMCSPLMAAGDRVLGLLYVDSVTAANSFSDEDLQFLVAFSGLVAIGIRNSRYADQVKREALVRSNFERYFAPNIAAEIAQQDTVVPLGGDRRPITILFSDIRGLHLDGRVDAARRHRPAPDRVLQRDGGDHLRARRHARQVRGRLRSWRSGVPRSPMPDDPDRALRAAVAMQHGIAPAQRAVGQRGTARDRGGYRDQLRRGLRGQHRQPPAAGVHRHRRRGKRGQPALLRGRARGDPGERGAVSGGEGTRGVRVSAGDGATGKDPVGAGL